MSARRQDAGAAVAGLFANVTATGGLASREHSAPGPAERRGSAADDDGGVDTHVSEARSLASPSVGALERTSSVRVGVELTEEQSSFLRALSRPRRTNGPRTLGTKFVATGVLVAAIELLRTVEVEMHGVTAGDAAEMAARARAALIQAGQRIEEEDRA